MGGMGELGDMRDMGERGGVLLSFGRGRRGERGKIKRKRKENERLG
jgi:hypothetical protein